MLAASRRSVGLAAVHSSARGCEIRRGWSAVSAEAVVLDLVVERADRQVEFLGHEPARGTMSSRRCLSAPAGWAVGCPRNLVIVDLECLGDELSHPVLIVDYQNASMSGLGL